MGQTQKTRYRGTNIGFVFQAYNLIPTLSVMENVAVPLLILGRSRAEAHSRAKEVLVRVGLEDKLAVLPADLSGGQQQRVAIARALVHSPKLIVCDEPTSALDADTGRLVMEILRQTALSADRALIIVTHDSRIFNFADRIARMDDGRIVLVEPQVAHQ
jgi:putative ABC transport system ATP-binding protein